MASLRKKAVAKDDFYNSIGKFEDVLKIIGFKIWDIKEMFSDGDGDFVKGKLAYYDDNSGTWYVYNKDTGKIDVYYEDVDGDSIKQSSQSLGKGELIDLTFPD